MPDNIARFTRELAGLITEGGHSVNPSHPILVPVDDGAEGGPDSSPERVIQEVEKQCRQWAGKEQVADLAQTDLIAHTSGTTTGNSKLVSLTREALLASARATLDYLGGPGHWVVTLPVHHIAGLQMLTRAIISGTQPLVAQRPAGRFSLPQFIAATRQAAEQQAGALRLYTSLVPRQLERIMGDAQAVAAVRRYDAILVGGQATPAPLLQAARNIGLQIFTTYGSTETAAGCVYNSFPLPGVKLRLSADGVIQIAGEQLMSGYLNAPSPFVEENGIRWLETSDLGRLGSDGSLQVTGRTDDLLIIGGLKVQPGLVEEILRSHPLISDAAVVAIQSETSPRLGALLAPSSSAPNPFPAQTWRQLADAISSQLGHASVPQIVKTTPALPLRGIGKVDRAAARALLSAPGGRLGAESATSEE
ncbi:AMP-binding protein [Boudabousia marimammalium]|nr:AMP-binding protein [Boudabousia marimammalium]